MSGISGQPVCLWSTFFFPQGSEVENRDFRLFTCPLGQFGQGFDRCLTRGETNLMESGSHGHPNEVVFYSLRWTPAWAAEEELGPMEQLARTGMDTPELRFSRFWHHSSVSLETNQTQMMAAPGLREHVPLIWHIPQWDRLAVTVHFGSDAPVLPEDCRLRATLLGLAVREHEVDDVKKAIGKRYMNLEMSL